MRTFSTRVLTGGLKNTIALDFYHHNGTNIIYWTDVLDDKIFKAVVDDTGKKVSFSDTFNGLNTK